jgi:PAS domain S-box-containing protein
VKDQNKTKQQLVNELNELRQAYDELERKVRGHTAELISANAALQTELAERKRTEQAWRDSEERYRRLVETTPDAISLTDLAGNILLCNRQAALLQGLERAEEMIGRNAFEFVAPESAQLAIENARKTLEMGSVRNIEYISVRQDGTCFPVELSASVILDADGKPNALLGVVRDITARKQAEEALRESEVIFSSFLEHSPIYVFFKDKDTRALRLSKNYEQMLGMPLDRALGKTMDDLFPSDLAKSMVADDLRVLNEGRRVDVVEELGGRIYETTKFPIIKDGKPFILAGFTVDITERRRAEETLRTSEARYRAVVEDMPVLICRFLPDGVLTFVNDHYCAYFNQRCEDLVGCNFYQFIPEAERESVRQHYGALTPDRPTVTYEHQVVGPDGTLRWQRWTDRALFDVHSRPVEYQSIGEDITDRKQAEEELRESQQLMSVALRTARAGAWKWDRNTNKATWSDENYLVMGLAPGSVESAYANWLACVHPDDRQEAELRVAEAIEQRGELNAEFRVIWPDDSLHWINDIGQMIYDDAGEPIGMYGIQMDITERKRVEEALRQYTERLSILHEIDQSILAARSIEDIADAALSRLPRFAPIWRVKALLFDFVTEEAVSVAHYCAGVKQPIDERQPLAELGPVVNLQPGEVHAINDLTELLDPSPNQLRQISDGARSSIDAPLIVLGRQIGLLSVAATQWNAFQGEMVDVAREVADVLAVAIQNAHLLERAQRQTRELEQRVIERTRELAAANERLTELDRLKSKFVSDVSHELRTPIANLKLHVELLEHGRPDKRAHYQAVVRQQARRLSQLVDDILNLSRLDMVSERATLGLVDLNFVVEQIVAAHQPRAEAAKLTLSFDPQPGLPPVRGEVNQLAQVVTNLVMNAVNYTPQGLVRVTTLRQGDEACLQIEDSGIGIDPADLPNIFDRFYRGRGSQRSETPGTGLGLAIVKEIIDLHNGRIEVNSQMRQGTTFKVWLPLFRVSDA